MQHWLAATVVCSLTGGQVDHGVCHAAHSASADNKTVAPGALPLPRCLPYVSGTPEMLAVSPCAEPCVLLILLRPRGLSVLSDSAQVSGSRPDIASLAQHLCMCANDSVQLRGWSHNSVQRRGIRLLYC